MGALIEEMMTLREVAFAVCTAFDHHGIVAVLSGGGAATIYAPNDYQSRDIDWVTEWRGHGGQQVLNKLGYVLQGQQYVHTSNPFTLDFPPGPLMVGDDEIQKWDTLFEGSQLLHVISPTDSVRDRLAAYLHWNDVPSLEVALAVARHQPIDLPLVEEWCRREGRPDRFEVFRRRLGKS